MDWFFFSSRRRHTRYWRDWSSDVCSSDLGVRVRCNPHPGVFGLAPSAELRRRITEREAELAERGGFALPPDAADAVPEGVGEEALRTIVPHETAGDIDIKQLSPRSEEHKSELQSRQYLVCRLLLAKKKKDNI